MKSENPLNLDVLNQSCVNPDVFFGECFTGVEGLVRLKVYWEEIIGMYPVHLQAYIRCMEWMELLGVFVKRWGVDCCDDDIVKYCRKVGDERPVIKKQMEERRQDMTGIRKHREWIESPNPPYPRELIESVSLDWYYRSVWIPKVEAFIQKWTSDYVPDDIKRSLAEIKERYPIDR